MGLDKGESLVKDVETQPKENPNKSCSLQGQALISLSTLYTVSGTWQVLNEVLLNEGLPSQLH